MTSTVLEDNAIGIGWNGAYFIGKWTPITVTLPLDSTKRGTYQLQITASDPDGHRVVHDHGLIHCDEGASTLRGFVKIGRPESELEVKVIAADKQTSYFWKAFPKAGTSYSQPLPIGSRLVVTLGQPAGFLDKNDKQSSNEQKEGNPQKSGLTRHINIAPERIPTDPFGWSGVSMFVMSTETSLSPEQSNGLERWTATGGHFVFSLPSDSEKAKQVVAPFSNWLPFQVGDSPIIVREFPKLVAYSGQTEGITLRERLAIPQLKFSSAKVLAGGRDDAQLARAPYGLGTVTMLAMDLTRPPLSQWAGIDSLARRLVTDAIPVDDTTSATSQRHARLSSTGINDLATQLHAIQDDFTQEDAKQPTSQKPAVTESRAPSSPQPMSRPSPWFVMGLMIVFLMIIGPVDYVVVHHVVKRPRATWVTFPLWVGITGFLAAQCAAAWNGNQMRANQFQLLSIDSTTSICRSRIWTNLLGDETRAIGKVTVAPRLSKTSTGHSKDTLSSRVSWEGIPESSFGGLYRPAGIELGRSSYSVHNGSDQATQPASTLIEKLPLLQWSTKSIITETTLKTQGLVDSELKSTGSGRLSGTITHRLGSPLEDWFVVYANRVYRQLKQRDDTTPIPLESKHIWRVEQPNVFQRELRPFLTGLITIAKKKSGSKYDDVEQRQIPYDPLSLDPDNFARILTFHDEAGGSGYTGLTNRLLADEDHSHLLKLGRALLFGRLSGRATELVVDSNPHDQSSDSNATKATQTQDNRITPQRDSTFVRIVLPVTVLSESTRQLDTFDIDKVSLPIPLPSESKTVPDP